jgi:hypothetical protein
MVLGGVMRVLADGWYERTEDGWAHHTLAGCTPVPGPRASRQSGTKPHTHPPAEIAACPWILATCAGSRVDGYNDATSLP